MDKQFPLTGPQKWSNPRQDWGPALWDFLYERVEMSQGQIVGPHWPRFWFVCCFLILNCQLHEIIPPDPGTIVWRNTGHCFPTPHLHWKWKKELLSETRRWWAFCEEVFSFSSVKIGGCLGMWNTWRGGHVSLCYLLPSPQDIQVSISRHCDAWHLSHKSSGSILCRVA